MSKREAARGTSEFIKRQRQTEKFTNAAVKKRRSLDATRRKNLKKLLKGQMQIELLQWKSMYLKMT